MNVHIIPTKWLKAYSWQTQEQLSNIKPSRLWVVPDSSRLLTVQVETLELKNMINEIMPMNEWHFCSAAGLNLPIPDNPADVQH
jgi:hypothetical protein